MRTLWIVFCKELTDGLRDRRSLMTILITAIVIGPAALLLMANFFSGVEQKSALRTIYVENLAHAPEFANFLQRNDFTVLTPPAAYEGQIRSGGFQDAVVVLPDDFSERLVHGQTIDVKLVYDDSRGDAQPSIRKAEALIRTFSREISITRTLERGLSAQLLQPINIERQNTATPKQQGAFLLFLIPMFALLGAVVGSMSAAIDTSAGERERGSLEPLLTNPISLVSLVVGKWLTVAAHSCSVVILTLAGFALATRFVAGDKLSTLFQFGAPEYIRFCALALPFACMIASVEMLVATYGRTYKEAQTYVSYIGLIVNFVPLVTIFASVKDATWQLLVPALAQQMVLARVLRGDAVGPIDYLLPLLIASCVTIAALVLMTGLLRKERIIFGR